jgi:peroxiredoxin
MQGRRWAIGILFVISVCYAEPGKRAPELKATFSNGDKFVLSEKVGRVILIHFWATWCKPCMVEMPAIDTYFRKHRSEGLDVVAISMDRAQDEAKVLEHGKMFTFATALAKNAEFKGYGRIWHLPMTFLIDRKGNLRDEDWDGDKGLDATKLETVVTPLLHQ